jgi:uncharacterized protein (DUF302 family)
MYIFEAGTALMHIAQTIGIDLPLKALVFEDGEDRTWLACNDPKWLAARHRIEGAETVLAAMAAMIQAVTKEATDRE